MFQVFRHLLYLILATILQTTWVPSIEIFGLQPDLILLVVVLIAAKAGHVEGVIFGFCVGLFQDAYSPADLGLNALTKSIVGFAVGLGRGGVMIDTLHVRLLIVCGAVLVHDPIYYVGHSDISLAHVPYYWVRYGIGRAVYSALIAGVFVSVFQARRRFVAE
jgi:rod shape-determining protein MreD